MKIQNPPGMRDFYPADMRLQNWLFDAWRRVSLRFGFEEYEGPIFEYLNLYTLKSGWEIVNQLFHVSRAAEPGAGRESGDESRFAIRPEMTPTLARMVAARAHALPRPIKWFSLPRMCRAERQQRGRLREFFQWNVDILGIDDPIADAETVSVAVSLFSEIGLDNTEIIVRLGHRPLAAAVLAALGVPPPDASKAFTLIDRFEKTPADEFAKAWDDAFGKTTPSTRIIELLQRASIEQCAELARQGGETGAVAVENFQQVWQRLADFGVQRFCKFDPGIVRGLAYYTGTVFEVHARKGGLRALIGGGRYDDLCGLLDGPRVPGVGFGMGDAPLFEALKELGKLPTLAPSLDVFVIDADESLFAKALEIASRLRAAGLSVDCSYKRQNVGKQIKQALERGARFAVIVGQEFTSAGQLAVKNFATKEQRDVNAAEFLERPRDFLVA